MLFLAAGTLGGWIKTGERAPAGAAFQIGLLKGAIHTDILLPLTAEVRSTYAFLDNAGLPIHAPQSQWIMLGWGARDFYTTTGTYADLEPGPVWRAVTGDSAVMRVLVVGPIPDQADVTWLNVTNAQMSELQQSIRASFRTVTPLDHPGLGGGDAFFAATGRFDIFRTCNVWAGDQLRNAGLRVGLWTPFPWSLP